MPVAAELPWTKRLARVLTGLSAPGALMCARGMLRAGVVVLAGLLSACSAPAKSGGAAGGEVETKADDGFDGYTRRVNELIHQKWKLYRTQSPNDKAHGSLTVYFYVGPMGKVERIHVKNTKETDPALTRFTVKAIQDAKLPPMPAAVIPLVQREHEGCMEFGIRLHLKERTKGGSAHASQERLVNAELTPEIRKQMDKRWGMLPETKLSSSAKPVRETTVELTSTPLARYYRQVTGQVEKKWHIYRLLRQNGVTVGSLEIVFFVNKKGKVEDLRILDDKKSNPVLTEITLRAIKDAEIPPMPADVIPSLPKGDLERLKIDYNAIIY